MYLGRRLLRDLLYHQHLLMTNQLCLLAAVSICSYLRVYI